MNIERRRVLKTLFLAGTALAAPQWVFGREYGHGQGVPWEPLTGDIPYHGTREERFLTSEERETVAAIFAILIPSDEDGPGATEAEAVTFIDRQLAGFYGQAQHWYMKGPFPAGAATQGYQSEHPPAQLYRLGLRELDLYCERDFGVPFRGLSEDDRHSVLEGLDNEEIEFTDVSAKTFFDLMLENVIEGFFSDPIYGGNRDLIGWRYVGFPGARYDYREFVNHNGARLDLPPVGLMGRPAWVRN